MSSMGLFILEGYPGNRSLESQHASVLWLCYPFDCSSHLLIVIVLLLFICTLTLFHIALVLIKDQTSGEGLEF
jgi:hypothetical protein